MRAFRPALAGIAILALTIAVLVVLQRRDTQTGPADLAHSPVDGERASRQVVLGATAGRDPASPAQKEFSEPSVGFIDGFCVQAVNEIAQFAQRERDAAHPDRTADLSEEQWRALLDKLLRDLPSQSDPEHRLVVHLLGELEERGSIGIPAVARLPELGALASDSDSPLLSWHALRACAEAKKSCPLAHSESKLLESHRENAEAWALVATLRYARGDSDGALAAMQGAASASTSNWYWRETIALVERSLAAQTALPHPDRASMASAIGVTALPSTFGLRDMCKAQSASKRAWGEACLAFSTLQAAHNDSEAAKWNAYSMREDALTALGETESAAEVKAERARRRVGEYAGGVELMASRGRLQDSLIMADPAMLRDYLDAVRRSGERAGSRQFLRRNVPLLVERAGLLGRDGMQECVAQLFDERAIETRLASAEHRIQVADELHISVSGESTRTYQVGPDGRFKMRRAPDIPALGMTTEQLQREIATVLSSGGQPPEVRVFAMSPRSRGELRREFEQALEESAGRR